MSSLSFCWVTSEKKWTVSSVDRTAGIFSDSYKKPGKQQVKSFLDEISLPR